MKVAFFIRHFNERGTEVSIYDYADYNEKILGNKSIIIGFKKEKYLSWMPWHPFKDEVFAHFKERFDIFQVDEFTDIEDLLKTENVDIFYNLPPGDDNEQYPYGYIYDTKTFNHCVYDTSHKYGDIYVPVSNVLNKKYGTNYPVLHHMIRVAETSEDLRNMYNIPRSAKVFGRHGGTNSFDINFVKEAIIETAKGNENIYFLFMNTDRFVNESIKNIIFLHCSVDLIQKRKFINTCDAMIHASKEGETFGIAVGEFAICKKPILSCYLPYKNDNHFQLLGDKIIPYTNKEDLTEIFLNKNLHDIDMNNNGYLECTPEKIMSKINELINTL